MIQRVMERIVRQEIPAAVIDNPDLDWCPETNEVRPAPGAKVAAGANLAEREPDRRYALWLANFHAARAADPYVPTAPTVIARAFDQQREIPEDGGRGTAGVGARLIRAFRPRRVGSHAPG